MEYKVLNHNNAACVVTDADIEEAINSGGALPRAIVQGMGKTHDEKYLEYLYPILYHEVNYMRFDAAQAIFNLNGLKGLEALKVRHDSIDPSDFERLPSEKAVLLAMIIRIEDGPEGVLRYFRSDDGLDIVKYSLLTYYSEGYAFREEDVRLIIDVLREFIDAKLRRIRKVAREDWIEFVYFALESLWIAARDTDVIAQMDDEVNGELVGLLKKVLDCKVTNDIKELMSDISLGMKRVYALELLGALKGKTGGGSARRAYKKALKHFDLTEEEL